jgi:hypothetical protein
MDDPGQYWFSILVHNETGEMLAMLTEDGQDPGPPDFKPIDDYYNRYWGTADSGAASGELVYQGIPVYQFFDSSIDDIIDNIGEPLSYEEYNGGRYHYDGITFVCNDSTGEIFSIELEPSACDVDGVALNKPGSRLLGILGTPTDQDFIRDVQGGTNDVVGWYMNYEREHYSFSFIMSDSGSIPSRIDIQPVAE